MNQTASSAGKRPQRRRPAEDPAAAVDALAKRALATDAAMGAWRAFLRAHASLMRHLASDLASKTGVTLGEFDVLMQLALAGGELRMADLAARALSSRSGMTRRIDRLIDDDLVQRAGSDADGRGVVVLLTDAGLKRLRQVLPTHLEEVSSRFVEPLDEEELLTLERALSKIAVDCDFG